MYYYLRENPDTWVAASHKLQDYLSYISSLCFSFDHNNEIIYFKKRSDINIDLFSKFEQFTVYGSKEHFVYALLPHIEERKAFSGLTMCFINEGIEVSWSQVTDSFNIQNQIHSQRALVIKRK